jgi:hypothetical protein
VSLNYDRFVTGYAYEADFFKDEDMPRLRDLAPSSLSQTKRDINDLVLSDGSSKGVINWRAATDVIVTRYSAVLQYLTFSAMSTTQHLKAQI